MSNIALSGRMYRVCSLSGTHRKVMEGELLQLQDLQKMLQVAINDAVAAKRQEEILRYLELGALVVKGLADIVIAGLATKTGAVGVVISYGYGTITNLIDAVSTGNSGKVALRTWLETKAMAADAVLEQAGRKQVAGVVYAAASAVHELADCYSRPVGDYNIAGVRKHLIVIQTKIKAVEDLLNGCDVQPGRILNVEA